MKSFDSWFVRPHMVVYNLMQKVIVYLIYILGFVNIFMHLIILYRAACLKSGRSLRNFSEEMRILQRENFNLKLRIFFLEEGQLRTNSAICSNAGFKSYDEPFSKQNIDLKVSNLWKKWVYEKKYTRTHIDGKLKTINW